MGGNFYRRGLYEIILAFFLVVVLVFAIVFFVFMNTSSSLLYGKVKQSSSGPRDASMLKDALLACHAVDYLRESMLDAQVAGTQSCPAQHMLAGFRVTRLGFNGCTEKVWDLSQGEHTQSIPYIVAVEGGGRCVARLDVFIGGSV